MSAADPLAGVRTVLLIDWPSREVPEALARSGRTVISNEGPETYRAYELRGGRVEVREASAPERADLVYAYRPLAELPELIAAARAVGAAAIWIQSGRDERGGKDPRGCWIAPEELARARAAAEAAGLRLIHERHIGDALTD